MNEPEHTTDYEESNEEGVNEDDVREDPESIDSNVND